MPNTDFAASCCTEVRLIQVYYHYQYPQQGGGQATIDADKDNKSDFPYPFYPYQSFGTDHGNFSKRGVMMDDTPGWKRVTLLGLPEVNTYDFYVIAFCTGWTTAPPADFRDSVFGFLAWGFAFQQTGDNLYGALVYVQDTQQDWSHLYSSRRTNNVMRPRMKVAYVGPGYDEYVFNYIAYLWGKR